VPPALVFQATATSGWRQDAGVRRRLSQGGGVIELGLYEGEKHTFVNETPARPTPRRRSSADRVRGQYGGGK